MIAELQKKIDNIIFNFKKNPEDFGDNVWRCYNDCKKVIQDYEKEHNVYFKPNDYNDYIKYTTDKLGI